MQRNNNGTHPACAACKHQRKKCNETCILAPVFPANRSREFHAVHKVFGVSNITKLVKNAKEEDRRRVVDSLIWEAFCRLKDPIQGPYGEYIKIYHDYKKVLDQLKTYKNQNQLLQLPYEGGGSGGVGVGSQPVQELITLDYVHDHDNKNCIIDSTIYATYHSNCLQDLENVRSEVVIPFRQHSQPYCITGQFSQTNHKGMEGSIWDGES